MENFMMYLQAFITGGIICTVGQILIDRTKLTPARILVIFVSSGAILGFLGIYGWIADFGGAGASVPLTGFGYALAKGAMKEVDRIGLLGAFSGGLIATAVGVAAAVFFGYFAAVMFRPKAKKN